MTTCCRVFDLDNDGVLSRYELSVLLRERLHIDMTEDDMDEFIGMADTSGKGQIDFHGFYQIMSRGGTAPPSRTQTSVTRQGTMANGVSRQATVVSRQSSAVDEARLKRQGSSVTGTAHKDAPDQGPSKGAPTLNDSTQQRDANESTSLQTEATIGESLEGQVTVEKPTSA